MAASSKRKDFDVKFKILLLGESSVGKSSIIKRLLGDQHNMLMMPTVGIDFERRNYKIKERNVQLEIWDTAGQERFRTITSFHYRNTKGMVMVYDVTNSVTFQRMKNYWIKSIDDQVSDSQPLPIIFVGNKIDLEDSRQVLRKEGAMMAERHFSHGFFETSALEGTNVEELFQHVAETMVDVWGLPPLSNAESSDPSGRRKSIKLHEVQKRKSSASCCS